MTWQTGSVKVNGQTWATRDANGADLIYPGPDGVTAYFQGAPIHAHDYPHVRLTQTLQREWGVVGWMD